MSYNKRTPELINKVVTAFNRTELEEGELIIDNSDKTLAKRLNLPYNTVVHILNDYSKQQIDGYLKGIDLTEEKEEKNCVFKKEVLNLLDEKLTVKQKAEIINMLNLKINSFKWK